MRTRTVHLLQAAVLAIVTTSTPGHARDLQSQRNAGEASDQERNETDPGVEARAMPRTASRKPHSHKATRTAAHQQTAAQHASSSRLKTGQFTPRDAKHVQTAKASLNSRSPQAHSGEATVAGKKSSTTPEPKKSTNDIHLKKNNARMF